MTPLFTLFLPHPKSITVARKKIRSSPVTSQYLKQGLASTPPNKKPPTAKFQFEKSTNRKVLDLNIHLCEQIAVGGFLEKALRSWCNFRKKNALCSWWILRKALCSWWTFRESTSQMVQFQKKNALCSWWILREALCSWWILRKALRSWWILRKALCNWWILRESTTQLADFKKKHFAVGGF